MPLGASRGLARIVRAVDGYPVRIRLLLPSRPFPAPLLSNRDSPDARPPVPTSPQAYTMPERRTPERPFRFCPIPLLGHATLAFPGPPPTALIGSPPNQNILIMHCAVLPYILAPLCHRPSPRLLDQRTPRPRRLQRLRAPAPAHANTTLANSAPDIQAPRQVPEMSTMPERRRRPPSPLRPTCSPMYPNNLITRRSSALPNTTLRCARSQQKKTQEHVLAWWPSNVLQSRAFELFSGHSAQR